MVIYEIYNTFPLRNFSRTRRYVTSHSFAWPDHFSVRSSSLWWKENEKKRSNHAKPVVADSFLSSTGYIIFKVINFEISLCSYNPIYIQYS